MERSTASCRLRRLVQALVLATPFSCTLVELPHAAPLAVRNQHPVQLTVPVLAPRSARTTAPATVAVGASFDWTNTLVLDGPGQDRIVLDGEMLRATLRVRTGIAPSLDVEASLPVMTTGGGSLDGFIESFHDAFGLGNDKRRAQTRGDFEMVAARSTVNNQQVEAWRMTPEALELGDVPVTLTWSRQAFDAFRFGVRMGVELPAGNENRGYGNGRIDGVVGLLGQWDGPGISAFGWLSHAFVSRPQRARLARVPYRDVTSGGLGLEVGAAEGLSLLGQLGWESSVLRALDDDRASGHQVLVWLGARLALGAKTDLEIAVAEDLARDVSPDVSFHAGVRVRL